NANGVTCSSLFQKYSLAWSDIDEFFVVAMRHQGLTVHEMVGFNFVPTYDRARAARALAKIAGRCEGSFPDTYGKKAAELADILTARLRDARLVRVGRS